MKDCKPIVGDNYLVKHVLVTSSPEPEVEVLCVHGTLAWCLNKDGAEQPVAIGIDRLKPVPPSEDILISEACSIVDNDKDCKDLNINLDCSIAQKAVVIALIKSGYRNINDIKV